MSLYEMISLVIGGVAAFMIIVTIRADHDRRKKQSTMDTAAMMLREAREVLQQEFDIIELTEKDMDRLKNYKILLAKINNAFGVFEHIAVAVKAGVYDKDLIFRTFGQTFVETYNQYRLYIEYRMKNHGKFTYCEIKSLGTDYTEEGNIGVRRHGKVWWSLLWR